VNDINKKIYDTDKMQRSIICRAPLFWAVSCGPQNVRLPRNRSQKNEILRPALDLKILERLSNTNIPT